MIPVRTETKMNGILKSTLDMILTTACTLDSVPTVACLPPTPNRAFDIITLSMLVYSMHHQCKSDYVGPLSVFVCCIPTFAVDIEQNGTTGFADDQIEASVMGEDGSVVLAGYGDGDFHVFKLDTHGSLMWHYKAGNQYVPSFFPTQNATVAFEFFRMRC